MDTPTPSPGEKFIHTESVIRLDKWERVADRGYLIAVLALSLFGGRWLADRGPNKIDALTTQVQQMAQSQDTNIKAVNDYAGQVNARLATLEKASGVPAPALQKK